MSRVLDFKTFEMPKKKVGPLSFYSALFFDFSVIRPYSFGVLWLQPFMFWPSIPSPIYRNNSVRGQKLSVTFIEGSKENRSGVTTLG